MTNENEFAVRVIVALLFAMSFALIGWVAPIMYASHAPADQFIEVHNFHAQDTQPDADQHYICFDRTVRQPTSGIVYTELYLITDDGERIEIASDSARRYFQGERAQVVTPLTLPDHLEEGEYRYALVAQLQLADGRVQRDFMFESEKFNVSEDAPAPSQSNFSC